jgi:hypothetical protein
VKLIQAMKQLKTLAIKCEDLRAKVAQHCTDLNIENAPYGDGQKAKIDEWMQSHSDTLKEILRLRVAIQRTNLATPVIIELDGVGVKKSIAEWIHRRRDLAKLELSMWQQLSDRNLKDQNVQSSPTSPVTEIRVRRYWEPATRDSKVALYKSEPTTIDASLEVANAVTDLIEE